MKTVTKENTPNLSIVLMVLVAVLMLGGTLGFIILGASWFWWGVVTVGFIILLATKPYKD